MLRSAILSQARKLSNDNDPTNPFHTDNQIHAFLDNWQIDLSTYLLFPRAQQTISFAVGDGGAATSKTLNTDILLILRVNWEPVSGSNYWQLRYRTEKEIEEESPDWRGLSSGSPAYYVIRDAVTAAAAAFTGRTITTDRPTDTAKTMRIQYVQMLAASTDGTLSPVFPPPLHITGVYYCAWQMYLPRNQGKAEYFQTLYLTERARLKQLSVMESLEAKDAAWDYAWV